MGWWRKLKKGERGDVLMEYVVITVFILLPLIGASTLLFNPSGRTFTTGGTIEGNDFGVFGNAMAQSFRRIMCGVALPIP
ncbi:MAG: hypothetical protein WC708_05410 [Lentisphaeria bacterium]